MRTKIKTKNILTFVSTIATLTDEFKKINLEITNNKELGYTIIVNNKDIHTLDIICLFKDRGIHVDIFYKICGVINKQTT